MGIFLAISLVINVVLYFVGTLLAAGITQQYSKDRRKNWGLAFFWPLLIFLAWLEEKEAKT